MGRKDHRGAVVKGLDDDCSSNACEEILDNPVNLNSKGIAQGFDFELDMAFRSCYLSFITYGSIQVDDQDDPITRIPTYAEFLRKKLGMIPDIDTKVFEYSATPLAIVIEAKIRNLKQFLETAGGADRAAFSGLFMTLFDELIGLASDEMKKFNFDRS